MALVDAVSFTAASGGPGAFLFARARASFRTPAQAVTDGALVNGATYSYLAQDSLTNPVQREWGHTIFTAASNSFARAPFGGVDNGTDTGVVPVSFSAPPIVSLTLLAEDVRQILTGNVNFYIATTGSDSNPGTLALPWATLQHALFFIASNIDIAGFTVFINVGAGSFAGAGVAACVGGGVIQINGAGSSHTTILDGPNDGVFNFGECLTINLFAGTVVAMNKVKADPTAIQPFPAPAFGCYVTNNLMVCGDYGNRFSSVGDVVIPTTGTGAIAFSVLGSQLYITEGNFVIAGGGNNPLYWANPVQGAIIVDQGTWSITGAADTYSVAFVELEDGAGYRNSNSSFSGSITGPQVFMRGACFCDLLGHGTSFFPGSFATSTIPSDCAFDTFQGPLPGLNTQTASYTLAIGDVGIRVEMNVAGANTVTVPTNVSVPFPLGTQIKVTQVGAGATTVAAAGGVTVHNAGALSGQWGSVMLYKRGTNEWVQTSV